MNLWYVDLCNELMTNDDELLVAVGLTLVVHRCQASACRGCAPGRSAVSPWRPRRPLRPAAPKRAQGSNASVGCLLLLLCACSQALCSRSRSSVCECESVSAYSYAEQRLFGEPLQALHLQLDRLRHVRDEHVHQEREEEYHVLQNPMTSRARER